MVIETYGFLFHLAAWFGGWAVAMLTGIMFRSIV